MNSQNKQEARDEKQEVGLPDGGVSMVIATDETKVYKYHVQIPEIWFAEKYVMWPNLTVKKKNVIQLQQMKQVAAFINNHNATVIFSGLPPEFKGWKLELIAAPENAYRQIVQSIGGMLQQQDEILIYKNTDLGAEILALGQANRKEVCDE